MEINPDIAKLVEWARNNINDPFAYDKNYIIEIANYIAKEHLPYDVDSFVAYTNQRCFLHHKETVNLFCKEIPKAQKRKKHPIKSVPIEQILGKS